MSYFKLKERKTTVRTEIVAGITTFMTMAYIIFVNPAILSAGGATGIPFEAAVIATCIGAGLMSMIMGLVTNTPFALASGMGINAVVIFFAVLINGGEGDIGIDETTILCAHGYLGQLCTGCGDFHWGASSDQFAA